MPSRRSHTKSHHGCLQCKQRRVKCDETPPNCQRCVRRGMPCSFTGASPSQYNASNSSDQNGHESHSLRSAPIYPNASSSNAPTPSSLDDTAGDTISATLPSAQHSFSHLDLELIHYYSTQTYMTMTSKLTAHLVWRDVIFQQGLKHDFLLHALMATAALHKATNHAEDSETHAAYIKVAFSYQNAALAGYIPALSQPSEDNAIALFILSALLTIWLFGSKKLPEALNCVNFTAAPNFLPQILRNSEHEPTEFLEILTLVQGINAVVKQTIHWLRGGEIDPLMKPPLDHELPPNPPDIEASFQKLERRIESDSVSGSPRAAAKEKMVVLLERLNALRWVARARTILEHDQQVFAWPVTSDPPFIDLIRQRDPTAIALFIHWAACFRCLDHLWWAKGWSYHLIKDASPLLDDSFTDILVWPRKEVGLET